MNVTGIGVGVTTLVEYIWTASIFTLGTIWILVGLLPESQAEKPLWKKLLWPVALCVQCTTKLRGRRVGPVCDLERHVPHIEVNLRTNDTM
jgi:hypothetical protein